MSCDFISSLYNLKPIKLLSEKEFVSVYLVQDSKTNRQSVAKIYKAQFNNEEEKKSFTMDVIAYSKLKEPSILPLANFNLFTNNTNQFPTIITEYMPKGSLDKVFEDVRSGTIPQGYNITKRLIIAIGVSIGMKFLHSIGITHQNLKPSNILLDNNFHPRISNVYFSQYSHSNSNQSTDDYIYIAPEVLKNHEESMKSNVYSYSMILYQLLTGKMPFEGCSSSNQLLTEYIKLNKRPDLTPIPDLRIKHFLTRCWSDDPNDRPTFDEIYEEITEDRYYHVFRANSDSIGHYLYTFIEDIKKSNSDILKNAEERPSVWLKKFADQGNPKAMYKYGVMLEEGAGVRVDKREAARYFKMSADLGNSDAMYRYALLLINGKGGVKMNKKEAFKYLKQCSNKGNTSAMFKAGIMLYSGDGIPMNKREAVDYFVTAGKEGHVNALFNVGYMMEHGDGVPVNKREAARFYKKAADGGNVEAMVSYAILVENGDGVEMDKPEAVKYYKMAAEGGNLDANLTYGYLCDVGEGTEVNKSEAVRCYKLGADKGNVRSMISYAYKLNEGDGIEMDKKEAAKYFKMAGDKGDSEGMLKYSIMAYQGQGIEMNKKEAAKYAKMSAEQNNPYAMYFYGVFLLTGEGGVVNKKEAAKFLKKSADNGNVHAIYRYGTMLSKGEGIPKNKELAERYFKMAEDMGYSMADEFMDEEEEETDFE